ncbi:MAG: copper resistance CopC family protein, partial [Dermatophilaceae bacterium]
MRRILLVVIVAVAMTAVGGSGAGATPSEVSRGWTSGASAALTTPGIPGTMSMHASLTGSTPADGSTVETVRTVALTFDEAPTTQFAHITVVGPRGSEVVGTPVVAGRTLTQALAPDLPAGEYTATYRIVSIDGHPI